MDGRSSRILARPDPVHEVHGLACRHSAVPVMARAHRHDDVEVALAVGGAVEHEHGGRRVRVPAGSAVVFWAALPHRVAWADPGATVRWLTVPLADALAWDVEGRHTARLLGGALSVHPDRDADAGVMRRWDDDLASGSAPRRRAAELEVRAHLDRLGLAPAADPGPPADPDPHPRRVAAMAAFVAARFREPVSVADIAAHVHLHPATASALFRAATGVPPGAFLLQCRLAEAQRLLLLTDAGTDEVAARAGFGSTSAFYARFTRDQGCPPAAYRRRLRAAAAR